MQSTYDWYLKRSLLTQKRTAYINLAASLDPVASCKLDAKHVAIEEKSCTSSEVDLAWDTAGRLFHNANNAGL